jgi:hypothetical protein
MVAVLKRASAVMGMVVMLPIAFMLARGELSAPDAGARAVILLLVVLGIRRLLGFMAFMDPGERGGDAAGGQASGRLSGDRSGADHIDQAVGEAPADAQT